MALFARERQKQNLLNYFGDNFDALPTKEVFDYMLDTYGHMCDEPGCEGLDLLIYYVKKESTVPRQSNDRTVQNGNAPIPYTINPRDQHLPSSDHDSFKQFSRPGIKRPFPTLTSDTKFPKY